MRKRRFVCIILSIVICIFSLVPVSASADLTREDCVRASEWCEYACPYTYKNMGLIDSQLIAFMDYCSGYSNCFIVSNLMNDAGDISCIYYFCNEDITVSNGSSDYNKVYVTVGRSNVATIVKYADGSDTTVGYSTCPRSMLSYTSACPFSPWYMYFTGGISSTYIDDNFLFGLTGISDYTFLDALGNALVGGSPLLSQIDFIRNMFQNNFKSKTGITDDNELNDIMTATASGDFTVLDKYVSNSATKQGLIDSVSSMQSFYNDNFSYDSDNDTYTVLNYDPENNIYPSWYVTNVDIDSGVSGSGSTSVNGSNAFAYGYGGNSSSSVGDIIINNNIPETTTGGGSHISDDFNVDMSNFEVLLNECLNAFEFFKRGFSVFPASIWICFSCLCTDI